MASLTTFIALLAAILAIAIGNNYADMAIAAALCIPAAAMLAIVLREGADG